ncbi:unnamed protein product [Clavelina lepadiformis]|uniref:Caspase family p20 domain-containing protein n=1 Tax=Clavelina lepadiformis TaxID=159417 RepID=A0ABP0FR23_CLALP
MAEQSTSSNVNITDAVLNQSPVIKDAENVTINYMQPPSTSSSDEDEWNSMRKLRKLCIVCFEIEGKLCLQGVSAKEEIPVVHPTIHQIKYYGKDTVPVDERYEPEDQNKLFENKINREVRFQDLLDLKDKFISIVASAGSGKTVLSLRLAKAFSLLQRLCIHLKLMDANYEQPLTLRQFLLDNKFPGHSEEFYTDCFSWMQKKDDKIVLILDGLDQAQDSLEEISPKINYNACVPVKDLVFNLCRKQFFPNSLLIITSRLHALLYLPEPVRPQVTYALGDLSLEDTKELFFAFADEDLWRKINTTSSQMLSICRNPLMLQMIISSNIHPSDDIGDVSTPTRLFATVMENLKGCRNIRFPKTMDDLVLKLQVLAFAATKHGKVVLTAKELRNAGMDPTTIHDVVVQLHCHRSPINSRLLEGNTKFFFCHQTFQEHLTASYVVYRMPVEEFQDFVETSLFEKHWTVVRRFVSGLLFDLESKTVSGDLQMKKEILKKRLTQQLEIFSEKYTEPRPDYEALRDKLFDLYACVGEGKDSSIATKAAELFPTTLKLPQPMNSNLVPGFCFVMKHVTKQLDLLSLFRCFLDANSFHEIASVIKEMKPGQIRKMNIRGNHLQPSNIDDVIGLFRVVRDEMLMGRCFVVDDGRRRDANQDEINQLHTSLNQILTGLEVVLDLVTTLRSQKCLKCELASEVSKPNVKQLSESVTSGLQSNQSLTEDVDLNKMAPTKSAMKGFLDEEFLDFRTSDKKTALQAPSKPPQLNSLPSPVDFLTMDYSPVQTSLIIGKQGGLVKLGGCLIEIPEGAMKENMFFTFTLIYDDKAYKEIPGKIKLTPTLKCSPSYKFEKAVTITLPTCYLPDKSDVIVTPQTKHEENWSCLEQVRFGDEFSITFKDSSFCKKTVLGDAEDVDKKRLLFKHYKDPVDENGHRIVWTILDGDEFVEESLAHQHFYLDIKREQNLVIQLHSPNTDFENGRIILKSKELFQQRVIKRLFSVFDHDDSMVPLLDDVYYYDVIDESSGEVFHSGGGSFKLTLPTSAAVGSSPISDEHAHIDGQVVVHPASQGDYDDHLHNDDIYKIVQRPKAHVLFLYNTRFPTWSTEADLRQIEPKLDLLRQLFEGLGCQVDVRSNISAEEMKETIKLFSASDRHTDFCALFIVSHGGHVGCVGDVVYASDAGYLTISEITSFFTPTKRSSSLVDKPRMLFFHCCRGVATDTGVRWISQMARSSLTVLRYLTRCRKRNPKLHREYRSLQLRYSVYHNPRSLHIATIQSTEEAHKSDGSFVLR